MFSVCVLLANACSIGRIMALLVFHRPWGNMSSEREVGFHTKKIVSKYSCAN